MYIHQVAYSKPSASQTAVTGWAELPGCQQSTQGYAAGTYLFYEGDDAAFVHEVVTGIVCNFRTMSDGRRQVVSFSYPGDLIGLVQGERHRFSSQTVSPARIRRIPKGALLKSAAARPEIAERLLDFATSELAILQERFVTLNRKSAQERIATFFLELVERLGDGNKGGSVTLTLPMRRRDMADYLGLSVETVSRILTVMKNSGVIDLPHSSVVVIRDIFELEDLAECEDEF
ncbi:MAG: transcriptional regulator [Rhodospirillales bacterium CG15_BIG_FIL_POST_REV_8_21_14_020_66_15]|nr:MAG: transcriptional regulator [Rhodospirillales bacterium CG15_BIG_FIL_POST_REV_8_21_14_020_66_15]